MKYDYMNPEHLKITHSEEYKAYVKALCWIASEYVSRIRVQFAEKAFEKYQDETTRRIVLQYGIEHEKLEKSRLFDFWIASEREVNGEESLNDTCLNHARHYAATVKMLFDIK